jgi:uncharacterized membrane protein
MNPGGGMNPYGPPGGGMNPQTGAGRFFKTAAIGGAIAGVLSAIPLISALNCCFCLLVQGGAIIGVQMYLKEWSQDRLSGGEAATSGAISGVVSGVIAGILGIIVNLIFGTANFAMVARQLPPDVARNLGPMLAGGIVGGIVMLFVGTIIHAGFGALGGFLGLTLFFKDRAKQ